MPKIAIVDKIHSDGTKLLEENTKFQYDKFRKNENDEKKCSNY